MANLIHELDAQLGELLSGWNLLSALLVLVTAAVAAYPLLFSKDADTHPMLLARQAHVAPVRQPGESAVHRSLEVPHGFPLKTGLDVRPEGVGRWTEGRDGDLRDIWRRVLDGARSEDNKSTGKTGKILTIRGREEVVEHNLASISRQINVIGQHVKQNGGTCVGIYLPNSVELMSVVFAGAFYGFKPVLIPYNRPAQTILKLLDLASVDYLIAAAGCVPGADLKTQCPQIRGTCWFVEESSRQMDWKENAGGSESVWHELVESSNQSSDLPETSETEYVPDIITFWFNEELDSGEMVVFTQKHLVAAVGAQISAIPKKFRLGPTDIFLPAEALSAQYILVSTLAALHSNATVAFNSVASPGIDLNLAARGVSPTIIAASSESAQKLHASISPSVAGTAKKLALKMQTQALISGVMPSNEDFLSKINEPVTATIGVKPGKLRLMYVYERTKSKSKGLTSVELSDLRAFTGARVIYSLTTPMVAGAVAQTGYYDYRREEHSDRQHSHFGVPPSCVEVKVIDNGNYKTEEGGLQHGQVIVSGPAVVNKTVNLDIIASLRQDGTLAYI